MIEIIKWHALLEVPGLDVGEFYAPNDHATALAVARDFFRYRGGPVTRVQRANATGWL